MKPAASPASALRSARAALRQAARSEAVAELRVFFKCGADGYGAVDDRFLAVPVPAVRRIVRASDGISPEGVLELLRSPIHEERLLALLVLARRFERGDEAERAEIVRAYLDHLSYVNNWDLVDSSAPYLLGPWLLGRDRKILAELARSPTLWERRIAIVSTLAFIREGDLQWTFRLAKALLRDPHDLMHKATGWMLREAGKRDLEKLRKFLDRHATVMPRTMLRYAIERLDEAERQGYLRRPRAR